RPLSLRRIMLPHPGGTTPILVGAGALTEAAGRLGRWLDGRAVFALSDRRVRRLHGEQLDGLAGRAARWRWLTVASGEGAKDLATAEDLWQRLLAAGGKRDSRILALGGGSIGDLGGFVSGCFLRGVEYVQLPTTLLAQVDAAVGGKTAVNLPGAKNSVGLFHHPVLVVVDTGCLSTLPPRELRSGLAEVIKMAALLDTRLLGLLERQWDQLVAADAEALAPVVAAAVRAKATVVVADPNEAGERRLLNFGHTLGHAIEAVLDYRRLRHGEAVAYGMLFALRLARRRGLGSKEVDRLQALIRRLELPALPKMGRARLLAAMGRDKKARESGLAWVLPEALGRGVLVDDIDGPELRRELAAFLADPWD
ncbi:MAG: 3-dehydroquinate synthase, partial [Thermoanaerobaculia bacterium]